MLGLRSVRSAVLYTALALGANAAAADPALKAVLAGDMKKFAPLETPGAPVSGALVDAEDAPRDLAEYRGKVVVLNFWATWCAPCRAEMPALDALEAARGGDDFAVVTVATGRNPVPAIKRFFAETGVEHLPMLRDPRQALAREMGVLGLPVTVILDREGRELGRLMGDAAWDGPEAAALIDAILARG